MSLFRPIDESPQRIASTKRQIGKRTKHSAKTKKTPQKFSRGSKRPGPPAFPPSKKSNNVSKIGQAYISTQSTKRSSQPSRNNDGNPATAFFIKNVMLSTDPESMKITARDADMHHVYPDNFIRAEIQRMRPYLKDTMARRAGSMRQGEEFIGYINVISK